MSKFSAIVCDHCDARDVVNDPVVPIHKIKSVVIVMDGDEMLPDLCAKCYDELKATIFRLTTQQPREVREH